VIRWASRFLRLTGDTSWFLRLTGDTNWFLRLTEDTSWFLRLTVDTVVIIPALFDNGKNLWNVRLSLKDMTQFDVTCTYIVSIRLYGIRHTVYEF